MALQLPRDWRLQPARYRLLAGKCTQCGTYSVPQRPACPSCGSTGVETAEVSGRGEVYTHTTMYKAPDSFESGLPYAVALVRLEEGPLVSAQMTDVAPDDVHVGMPVEVVFRRWRSYGSDGHIIYGYKFRPAQWGEPETAQ